MFAVCNFVPPAGIKRWLKVSCCCFPYPHNYLELEKQREKELFKQKMDGHIEKGRFPYQLKIAFVVFIKWFFFLKCLYASLLFLRRYIGVLFTPMSHLPFDLNFLSNSPTLHFSAAPSFLFFLAPLAVVFDMFSSLWFCCSLHPSSVLSRRQLCGGQLHYRRSKGNRLLRGRAVEREGSRGKKTAAVSRATAIKRRFCAHAFISSVCSWLNREIFTRWIKRRTGFLQGATTAWYLQIVHRWCSYFFLYFFSNEKMNAHADFCLVF